MSAACSMASCGNCGACTAAWEREDDMDTTEDMESPVERAAQSATGAIEDLDAALWQAKTRAELITVRVMAETLIQRLDATICTALTLDEQFDEMRRPK